MKLCSGTKKIQGCGFTKDESEFYPVKGKWRENVCIDCTKAHRRNQYKAKIQIEKIANGAW